MKWVTRARPKVDRVACPWLIRRFVDPQAEFLYVPPDEVWEVMQRQGAIPFDVPNVELGHHGSECSFDAVIKKYNLTDPALARLAVIVRGADTAANELALQSAGLEAVAEASGSSIATITSFWSERCPCTTRCMHIVKIPKKGRRFYDIRTEITLL